jgi:PmbA protein
MDKKTAEKILNFSKDLKADAAEIYLRSSSSTTIEVKEQKVDAFERARDIGAGLRLLVGKSMGFAFTTDVTDSALRALVHASVTNARNTEPDPFQSFPENPGSRDREMAIYDPEIVTLTEEEKISRVMAMERDAFGVDSRIKRVRKASAGFFNAETLIMNTKGAEVYFKSTVCSSGIEVVAEEHGESQAGSDYDAKRMYRKLDIEATGRKAAHKALDLLGARHIGSVNAPVILESTVAEEFLGLMASGFSAESVQKKRSLFIGKLGKDVASPAVTVIDDGLLENGLGTSPCDDELVPVKKKVVIERGRLSLFLYNTYTANKDKVESTGNGMRGGFKGVPGVGITNLYIEPGDKPLEELIASVDKGLLVTEVMGMHTANAISGDFSVGAVGFWIEKGKKAYPVREITIAGNILDLMKHVDAVGNDIRFSGRIGCPSLRIRELSIGGT